MNYSSYIPLIPLLPLASFVLLGLFGRKYLKNISGVIGCIVLLASTALAIFAAYNYFFVQGKVDVHAVQNKFNCHEHRDHVAPRKQSVHAYKK